MKDKLNTFKDKIIDRYFEVEDGNDEKIVDVKVSEIKENKVDKPLKKVESEVAIVLKPTVISAGTELQGNISGQNDLEIRGKIIGDIVIQGQLIIESGEVIGNIKAGSVMINQSKISGNIDSDTTIQIHSKAYVKGYLKGKDIILDSDCQGNIFAKESLQLLSQARVKGDICVKKIRIDEGAIVDGQMKMLDKNKS